MSDLPDLSIHQLCAANPWCTETNGKISFGDVPETFDRLADLLPGESGAPFRQKAELARQIYRRQALAALDPAKVEALCEKEPWTRAEKMEYVLGSKYGYVPEKLKRAASLFPADSAEHTAFMEAREKARWIYFRGMQDLSRKFAEGNSRRNVEVMASTLWNAARQFENDGTSRFNRIYSVCEYMSGYQQGLHLDPSQRPASPPASPNTLHLKIRFTDPQYQGGGGPTAP